MDLAKAIRVGLAIRDERKSWLAAELNISKQHLNSLCHGIRTPNLNMITSISDAFKVTESEFIGWGDL